MSDFTEPLTESRQRIRAAFDPALLRDLGHRLADLLGEHMQRVQGSEAAVLNWHDPLENVAFAGAMLDGE
ncbi:MAG: hypothetical protein ACREJB_04270, partial [Planctomycetaceae bacterium]